MGRQVARLARAPFCCDLAGEARTEKVLIYIIRGGSHGHVVGPQKAVDTVSLLSDTQGTMDKPPQTHPEICG